MPANAPGQKTSMTQHNRKQNMETDNYSLLAFILYSKDSTYGMRALINARESKGSSCGSEVK